MVAICTTGPLQLEAENGRVLRHIDRAGRNRILRLVRPMSLDRIKDAIRFRTPRKSGESLAVQIARLNPVLRGWYAYFRA